MFGSYGQVWFLYHMDLRCILVAMIVYSTQGFSLYWSASMSLVTCVYESTYWCTTDAYLTVCSDRANIFISWKRLVLKALVYHVTLRLMLWGASCYTKILSPSCDKTFDIPTCPESQLLEWRLNGFLSVCHTNSQHRSSSLIQDRYPYSHRFSSVVHKRCHYPCPLVHRWLLPEPLCQRRKTAVPWVKG